MLLPHVARLPDRITDIVGLSDGSYKVSTSKGVYAVDANLVVGGQVPAGDDVDLGEYQRARYATPDGFVAVGSDRIVIDKAGKRATIHTGERYVYVTPFGENVAVADKTGLQIFDASGEELVRSAEAYLTEAPIVIGNTLVVPALRSVFIFDENAQKIGELADTSGIVKAFAGGVIVAPKTSYSDEDQRTRVRYLALDGTTLRERWTVDAPRTKLITILGDRLVLLIEDGAWIVDATGRVNAKIDGLGYVSGAAAFEDGIAITGANATKWWRPSGTIELSYDDALGTARTVPAGLATAAGEVLLIWRTDVQGPEPVPLTTDLPMNVPIVVDGTPMIIEGTNRFSLRARIHGREHSRSPQYASWRPITTRDEAVPLLERLIARTFDGPLPAIPAEGQWFEKSAALAQLPLAQTVDLVGRGLFAMSSLEPEVARHANHLRTAFLDELATALGTRSRLLLASIRARKVKLEPPRTVPTSYDYLGTFTTSGALTAADPCYLGKKSSGGFSFTQKIAALEGLWHAFVRRADKEPDRNAEIAVVHADAFAIYASTSAGNVGVDAGIAGVFDKACPKPNLDLGLDDGTVSGLGAAAGSGYGDGMYPVFVGKQAGKVAKIRIVFIDDTPEVDRLVALPAAGTGKPYSASSKFVLGDTIEHVKFGMGSVIRVGTDGKIDVRFADAVRTLIHAKK